MSDAIALISGAFFIALICAALMGFGIQRGATCMVAAMDEVITKRRGHRIVALAEAALWVAGGLLTAQLFGRLMMLPQGFAVTGWTVAGGLLLGLGAFLNRACVFGAIARIGSGEWAYLMTPAGFYLGCLIAGPLLAAARPVPLQSPSPLTVAGPILLLALIPFVVWQGIAAVRAARAGRLAAHLWTPHRATAMIGIAFVVMMLTVGSWAYTEALAAWARGMASNIVAKTALFVGLLLGAVVGGWGAGAMRGGMPPVSAIIRCTLGGMLMGAGSVLIPGGNDGLILIGLPLLQPHAWAAIITMGGAIAAGMLIERRITALATA